ncbi:glutathione S-transferase [Arboricoccus pini]|uniref:Glutathione S-transferase n=1 Tax=Arboricoccus pini TaxID=1963835 RepID=A0A212QY05_9PROT|nr:glutathione S-transferase family protein [Arboricoccus pini]SNB64614.1 glutathione S-transferase [Arboricoccus pini]
MPELELVIGSKNWSSWSLRPWLLLRELHIPFKETLIPLRRPDTAAMIAPRSPSGWVPVLHVDGQPVWDSLSIAEFIAELDQRAWPEARMARAHARSISAEMHSGFGTLRKLMPMAFAERIQPDAETLAAVAPNVARIDAIWTDCRARYAGDGPFLFGRFSAADAMWAPVVSRFTTYGVVLSPPAEAYRDMMMALPGMLAWAEAARAELEAGHA